MKKILLINCLPEWDNESHTTNQLTHYTNHLLENSGKYKIEQLNLYDENLLIPRIESPLLSAWNKKGQNLSDEELSVYNRQNDLVDQWIGADCIFIFSPLHNFNVTSKFKDYVDNILIAGKTFKYTTDGSVGLLNNDKKIIYIQSSGSEYNLDMKYVNADIAPHYVRTILSFMGITEMQLIRVEGLDIHRENKAALVEQAKEKLKDYLSKMA